MDYNITVKHLDVVDSTNRYLRDEADNLWINGKDIVEIVAYLTQDFLELVENLQ